MRWVLNSCKWKGRDGEKDRGRSLYQRKLSYYHSSLGSIAITLEQLW
jgi:hypothetical protein